MLLQSKSNFQHFVVRLNFKQVDDQIGEQFYNRLNEQIKSILPEAQGKNLQLEGIENYLDQNINKLETKYNLRIDKSSDICIETDGRLVSHPPQSVTSTLTLCSCWQNQNIQAAQGWQT